MASTSITQKPRMPQKQTRMPWLQIESDFRLWMDIHKSSWIYASVAGYGNKVTQEETIRYQSDETMARQLDTMSNLTLHIVTSQETE